jgi:hypothetical protein
LDSGLSCDSFIAAIRGLISFFYNTTDSVIYTDHGKMKDPASYARNGAGGVSDSQSGAESDSETGILKRTGRIRISTTRTYTYESTGNGACKSTDTEAESGSCVGSDNDNETHNKTCRR